MAIVLLIVFGMRDDPPSSDTSQARADTRSAKPEGTSSPIAEPVTTPISATTFNAVAPASSRDDTPNSAPNNNPPARAGQSMTEAREQTLEERARALAGGIGTRLTTAVEYAQEHVDVETLRAGGEKLGRLVPFVGPYLRYAEARELYREDDPQARERARRLAVIALADLALDAGSAGLSKTAAGSGGALEILDGAVNLAELSAMALTIRDAFGDERAVESLAGRALAEVDGLADVVEMLLTVDVRDELDTLPAELQERGRSLVEAVEQALQGSD